VTTAVFVTAKSLQSNTQTSVVAKRAPDGLPGSMEPTLTDELSVRWRRALTRFEEDDLIVLTEVHEARDALGKLDHVLDRVGDLNGTLLPHRLS